MKKWLALLLTLTITLSLTACNTSQPEPTEAPKADIPPTEYLPFEGETLTVLYMSGDQADTARAMAPEFEAVTGAKVEVIDYPYQDLHEQILLDLISYIGSYDVISIDSRWDGEFAPYLEPLDPYIAQDNYDMSVWIDNVLANCGQWQDTIVGIPTSCTPQVFAYRTDLLPDGIPDTWNDYRRALTSLNKPSSGIYGIAVSKAPEQMVDMFNRVLWSMGGNWADEDWNVTITCTETRTALNHLNAIKNMSDPACAEWTEEDALQAFLDGKAAVCETCSVTELLRRGDDPSQSQIVGNWALDLIPFDKTGLTTLSAWDAAIPVGSQNKDLAWEWIKMYTSYDMQNRFYDEFAIFSPRKAFWEQETMSGLHVIREALDYANNTWRIPAFLEAEADISNAITSFLSNKIYQDTAIKRMDTAVKSLLERIPPQEGSKNYNH